MSLLITTSALLIIATIVVSLATASDLQKQRQRIAKLERDALELELELELAEGQRKTADGSLALHTKLRDERLKKIAQLNEELEFLEEERVSEREIKVAGTHKKGLEEDDEG